MEHLNFQSFIIFYSLFLVSLAKLYITGHFIWQYYYNRFGLFNNKNFYISFVEKSIIGFAVISAFTAIYATKFITVNTIVLLLIMLWPVLYKLLEKDKNTIQVKFNNKNEKSSNKINWLLVFLAGTVIFNYTFWLGIGSSNVFFADWLFYAKLSRTIFDTGIEGTSSLYYNFSPQESISLYHYGDLWYNAFVLKLFKTSEINSLLYNTYPLLHTITFILIFGMIENYFKNKYLVIIASFALLYGIKIFFSEININLYGLTHMYRGLPLFTFASKLLYIHSIILLGLYYLHNKKIAGFSIMMGLAIVFHNTLIPSLAGGTILLIVLLFCANKTKYKLNYQYSISAFFIILLTIGLILIFNYIFSSSSSLSAGMTIYPIKTHIILFVEFLIKPFIEYPVIVIGIIITIILKKLTKDNILILFFIFSCIAGAGFFVALNHNLLGSQQAISNISPVLITFFGYILLGKIEKKTFLYIILIIMTASGIYNFSMNKKHEQKLSHPEIAYSINFKHRITNLLGETQAPFNWAILSNKQIIERWNYTYLSKGHELLKHNNINFPLEIGPYFNNIESYCKYEDNHQSPLCKFYSEHGTDTEKLIQFLKELEIKYIYIENENNIDSSFLNNLALVLKDDLSGESLWKIKKNNK